jgi:hypothetical protein
MNWLAGTLFLSIGLAITNSSCERKKTAPESEVSVVGGKPALPSDPFVKNAVAIVLRERTLCSGTLISDSVVITGAHCFYDEEKLEERPIPRGAFFVTFGIRAVLKGILSSKNPLSRTVKEVIYHKEHGNVLASELRKSNPTLPPDQFLAWARQRLAGKPPNDIALLILDNPAPSEFKPASLPNPQTEAKVGDPLLIAGYGVTNESNKTGTGVLFSVPTKIGSISPVEKEFVSGKTVGRSSCNGDSGGPVYLDQNQSLTLLGIVSRGPQQCAEAGVGTNTDLRFFEKWIRCGANPVDLSAACEAERKSMVVHQSWWTLPEVKQQTEPDKTKPPVSDEKQETVITEPTFLIEPFLSTKVNFQAHVPGATKIEIWVDKLSVPLFVITGEKGNFTYDFNTHGERTAILKAYQGDKEIANLLKTFLIP